MNSVTYKHKHSISDIHSEANIFHFQDNRPRCKQVAREAIHIRINNPALQMLHRKIYIQEIISHPIGAERSSSQSNQVLDSDLPQGCIHLIFLNNRFSRAVCFAN